MERGMLFIHFIFIALADNETTQSSTELIGS